MDEQTVPEIISEFLGTFRTLLKFLFDKAKAEGIADCPHLARARRIAGLAADFEPMKIIDNAGFYLYRFRDDIMKHDIDFFFSRIDFEETVEKTSDKQWVELTKRIIGRARDMYPRSTPGEKKYYTDSIRHLLDLYVEYLYKK